MLYHTRRSSHTFTRVSEDMCEVSHLSWWYDAPEKEKVTEVGVFRTLPDPIASESVEVVLEAALRARRTGLR